MHMEVDCEKYHELVNALIERMKHDSVEIRCLLAMVLMVHEAHPEYALLEKLEQARQTPEIRAAVESEFLPLSDSMEAARTAWTRRLIETMLGSMPVPHRVN